LMGVVAHGAFRAALRWLRPASAAMVKRTVAWLRVRSLISRQALSASSRRPNGPSTDCVPCTRRSNVRDSYWPPTTQYLWAVADPSLVVSGMLCSIVVVGRRFIPLL